MSKGIIIFDAMLGLGNVNDLRVLSVLVVPVLEDQCYAATEHLK